MSRRRWRWGILAKKLKIRVSLTGCMNGMSFLTDFKRIGDENEDSSHEIEFLDTEIGDSNRLIVKE